MKFNLGQLSERDRQLQQQAEQQRLQQQFSGFAQREQFAQEGTDPPPGEPEAPDKLKSALEKEREGRRNLEKEMKTLKQQLEAFSGVDPDAARRAQEILQTQQQWEEREQKLRAEVDSQYRPKLEDYDRQVKTYQQQLTETQQKLLNYQRDVVLEREFYKIGGFEGEFEAIAPALQSRTRINPETGELEVLGADGKRLYSKDDPSKPATPAQLMQELQKQHSWFARHFKGSESGGMGINGRSGYGNSPDLEGLNPWDKLAKLRSQGKV